MIIQSMRLLVLIYLIFSISQVVHSKKQKDDSKSDGKSSGPKILRADGKDMNMPSEMPTQQQEYVKEQYAKFMEDRKKQKQTEAEAKSRAQAQQQQQQQQQQQAIPQGMSPRKLGIVRDLSLDANLPTLTKDIILPVGEYWFGTQLEVAGAVVPSSRKDGADPRKRVSVKSFAIDEEVVTNRQFAAFVTATGYVTEAELYGWSFVFQSQASPETVAEVDGEQGYGRVKNSLHWLAVKNASWNHPFGLDSSIDGEVSLMDYPVVQVSHTDAVEYCAWAGGGKSTASGGLRLPTEKEWEYAARGGRVNQSYPWGDDFDASKLNIWGGKFPDQNDLVDAYETLAPIKSFPPNDYGIYNMLGNVWEWVAGGKASERILRGGSFIDSPDGSFNHMVLVSTRQINSGDSAGSNIGFRCARTIPWDSDDGNKAEDRKTTREDGKTRKKINDGDHIEL